MPHETSINPRPSTAGGRPLALVLATLAVLAAEAAMRRFDAAADVTTFAAAMSVGVAAVIVVAELLRRRHPSIGAEPRAISGTAAAAVAAAFAIEATLRLAADSSPLLDVLLLAFLRDVVVALALLSHHTWARRGCVGLAAFLSLAGSAAAADPRIQHAVILFAALGGWWLAGEHWNSIRGRLTATSAAPPRNGLFTGLPAVAIALPLLVPSYRLSTYAVEGFMPTSGGRRDSAASARSGVGDGDELVAGLHDIRSFAPVEDAPFINGHEPSLYDMYDDTYSEPVTRRIERAISLPPQMLADADNHDPATADRPSRPTRPFSTVRKGGGIPDRRLDNLESDALFHVKGRVPLHLKLESFAGFDGVSWLPEEEPHLAQQLTIETVAGRPWLKLGGCPSPGFCAQPEAHAIRVVRLDTNRIPTPQRLTGIHIDGVSQADFFAWAQPGIVRIERDQMPGQITLHLRSQVIDSRRFGDDFVCFLGGAEKYRQVGDDPLSQRVRALAESWVAGLPRGLPQVERVVERLRTLYRLDPEARVSGAGGHSVAEFLFDTRRGPDYLFASAAVFMLRSLDYSVRLVSGFHVDPRRYDPRADHTPVLPADVHFWAEVTIGPDLWLPIEPTPGYTLLTPRRSAWQQMLLAIQSTVASVIRHPIVSLAATIAAIALWRCRARIADIVDGFCFRLRRRQEDREQVLAALAFLERRCRRAGVGRPRHVTPPGWLASVRDSAVHLGLDDRPDEARVFVTLADEALYAPTFRLPPATDPRQLAESLWSWKRIAMVSAATAAKAVDVTGGRRASRGRVREAQTHGAHR